MSLQALHLYEQCKNPTASLMKCRDVWNANEKEDEVSSVRKHNEVILNHLSSLRRRRRRPSTNEETVDCSLAGVLSSIVNDLSVDRGDNRSEYNRLVATYNLGLVHYSCGKIDDALDVIMPLVWKFISSKKGDNSSSFESNVTMVVVRMAFLVLDCVIRRHDGDGLGVPPLHFHVDKRDIAINPLEVLTWIEENVVTFSIGESSNNGMFTSSSVNQDELKFRIQIYRSKLLFLGSPAETDMTARTRTSRKELKSAMDLYQNKLSSEKYDHKNDGSVEKTKVTGKPSSSVKGGGGGSKLTKSRGSNQSDVSSVTSIAGGSLVTSTSEGLSTAANVEKGGVVASCSFEGMPNKVITSDQTIVVTQSSQKGKAKRDNPDLHLQHEAVLYLKANLECLRGNTTKSLKLCSEARMAGRRSRSNQSETLDEREKDELNQARSNIAEESEVKDESPLSTENQIATHYDEAIYYNNLALVHQSEGKMHLALHYYSFSLDCISTAYQFDTALKDDSSTYFWSDGVSRPDITPEILSNTSLCAFQIGDFKKAYESMAQCVNISPGLFALRPRCWLRMGQSCIGMHSKSYDGIPATTLDSPEEKNGDEVTISNDISNILSTAALCLHRAIYLCKQPQPTHNLSDLDCYESAIVSLVYTKMEMDDPIGALETCRILLGSEKSISASAVSKQVATCRLYATESQCLLGDANAAFVTMFGSNDVEEEQLNGNEKSTESPLKWLVVAFSIEEAKQSDDVDNQTLKVKRILENKLLLYQMLKKGQTESAINVFRGG